MLRKPLWGHATSQIFCSKKLPIYAYNCTWVWKKLIHSFQELYLGLFDPKMTNLSNYEAYISKIIFKCIKNCHHQKNYHCWHVELGFCISTLVPLCWFEIVTNTHYSIVTFKFLTSENSSREIQISNLEIHILNLSTTVFRDQEFEGCKK